MASIDDYLSTDRLERIQRLVIGNTQLHVRDMAYSRKLFETTLELNQSKIENEQLIIDNKSKVAIISELIDVCEKNGIKDPIVTLASSHIRPVTPPISIPVTSNGTIKACPRSYSKSLTSDTDKEKAACNKIGVWFLERKLNPEYRFCRVHTLGVEDEPASAPAPEPGPASAPAPEPTPMSASAPTEMESSYDDMPGLMYEPGIYHEIPCGNNGIRGGPNCGCKCRQLARDICIVGEFMNPLDGPSMSLSQVVVEFNRNVWSREYTGMWDCIARNMTRERAIDSFNMCQACNCCERHQRCFPRAFNDLEPEAGYTFQEMHARMRPY